MKKVLSSLPLSLIMIGGIAGIASQLSAQKEILFQLTNKQAPAEIVIITKEGEVQPPRVLATKGSVVLMEVPQGVHILPKIKGGKWRLFTFEPARGQRVYVAITRLLAGNAVLGPDKIPNNIAAGQIKIKENAPPPKPVPAKPPAVKPKAPPLPPRPTPPPLPPRPTPPPLPPRPTPPPLPPRPKAPVDLLQEIRAGKELRKVEQEVKKMDPEKVPASSKARDDLLAAIRKGKELKPVEKVEKEILTPEEKEKLKNQYTSMANKNLDALENEWKNLNVKFIRLQLSIKTAETRGAKPSEKDIAERDLLEIKLKLIDEIADKFKEKTKEDEWGES